MGFIISAIASIGSVLFWVVKKFFPTLIKKFGLGAVKYGIQNFISGIIIVITIAFWSAMVYFITESYSYFKQFLNLISNPTGQSQFGSSQYLECFMNLLQSSGIAAGFNSAIVFTLMILIFMFSLIVYRTALSSLKLVSDEVSKSLKLI